ncbi:hypothetical protein [Nocardia sp. R7R-8]|uniref:hypothetical protein n=1 Tax=Nocardia sp. R7R-8 TaxID=3459304 RepID=UPI00403DD073
MLATNRSGEDRENAGWRIKMAENYIQGGEIAEGCQRLVDHFEQIGGMSSTRLRSTLNAVAVDVRPHATVPEVREFLGLLATV